MSSPTRSPLRVLDAEPEPDPEIEVINGNERSPLLAGYQKSRDGPPLSAPRHRNFVWVVAVVLATAFLIEIGDYMQRAPATRVIEDILCQQYYESTNPLGTQPSLPIPEADCKGPEVQSRLAMIRGWDMAFSCVPSILLAVPYGYVADRYGRKIVLTLGVGGVIISMAWAQAVAHLHSHVDIRWMWAGNAFQIIGGGAAVIKSTIYAILADVTPEDKRASVFFQLIAASVISTVVGVPLAWELMKKSSYLAMGVGLAIIAAGLLLSFLLPETLERAKASEAAFHSTIGDGTNEEGDQPPTPASTSSMPSVFGIIKSSSFVFATPALSGLVIAFVATIINTLAQVLLVQFVSERFDWPLADASFVLPYSAVSNFVILIVILPAMYWVLSNRFQIRPVVSDLIVARGSLIFIILGYIVIAWAPSAVILFGGVTILALGSGFSSAIRSLITSFVHADQVSRLYAVLAVTETVGGLVTSPVLSKAYGWGLRLGSAWSGMAFIVTMVAIIILGVPVWIIRAPKPEEDVHG